MQEDLIGHHERISIVQRQNYFAYKTILQTILHTVPAQQHLPGHFPLQPLRQPLRHQTQYPAPPASPAC